MLDFLREGNKRFVNNEPYDKDFHHERNQLKSGQKPYAIIVTCSDSRIPVGHIFDESFGKFFVIRTAGNIIDKIELGSIEYAASDLNTSLLLILGHTKCGAIDLAIEDYKVHSINLEEIIKKVKPAVITASEKYDTHLEIWEEAIKQNVLNQVEYVLKNSSIISELVAQKKLNIITGIYDLESGAVEFIQ